MSDPSGPGGATPTKSTTEPAPMTWRRLIALASAPGRPEAVTLALSKRILRGHEPAAPWFLNVFAGCGAWLAAIFLMCATGVALFRGPTSALPASLLYGCVALALYHGVNHFATRQAALAFLCASYGMFMIGVVETMGSGYRYGREAEFINAISAWVFTIGSFIAFPDRLYRFGAPLVALGFSAGALHSAGPPGLQVLALVTLAVTGGLLFYAPGARAFEPVIGAALAWSALHLCVDSFDHNNHYEMKWLDAGVYAIAVTLLIWKVAQVYLRPRPEFVAVAAVVCAVLGFGLNPGVIASIGLLVIGLTFNNRVVMSAGVAILCVFMSRYYYWLDLPLLHKSITLMAGGMLLLGVRGWLRHVTGRSQGPVGGSTCA